MTAHLGGKSSAGRQMKTTYGWRDGGNGTNSSGFSGLPSPYRIHEGNFQGHGGYGAAWWSSSPDKSLAWLRYLLSDSDEVFRSSGDRRGGYNVRCVRDNK